MFDSKEISLATAKIRTILDVVRRDKATTINLSNICRKCSRALAHLMKDHSPLDAITHIDLTENHLQVTMSKSLIREIRRLFPNMQSINFKHNALDDRKAITLLKGFIKAYPDVKLHINFSDNFITDEGQKLLQDISLDCPYVSINLEENLPAHAV